jgi:hypothetical protein
MNIIELAKECGTFYPGSKLCGTSDWVGLTNDQLTAFANAIVEEAINALEHKLAPDHFIDAVRDIKC